MLTEEQIKEIEASPLAKGRPCTVVRGKRKSDGSFPWEVVVRKPTRPEYKNYRALAVKGDPEAQEVIFRMVCVHPPKEAFDALLDDFPAIPEAAAKAIGDLVGIDADEPVKA